MTEKLANNGLKKFFKFLLISIFPLALGISIIIGGVVRYLFKIGSMYDPSEALELISLGILFIIISVISYIIDGAREGGYNHYQETQKLKKDLEYIEENVKIRLETFPQGDIKNIKEDIKTIKSQIIEIKSIQKGEDQDIVEPFEEKIKDNFKEVDLTKEEVEINDK